MDHSDTEHMRCSGCNGIVQVERSLAGRFTIGRTYETANGSWIVARADHHDVTCIRCRLDLPGRQARPQANAG